MKFFSLSLPSHGLWVFEEGERPLFSGLLAHPAQLQIRLVRTLRKGGTVENEWTHQFEHEGAS